MFNQLMHTEGLVKSAWNYSENHKFYLIKITMELEGVSILNKIDFHLKWSSINQMKKIPDLNS